MKAIRVEQTGGPEVLRIADVPDPVAGPNEVVVKVEAAGVNFIEVYQRTGLYPMSLPMIPGGEAAGTIIALGAESIFDFKVGDRVAWQGSPGAYAELATVPVERLVKIPEGVTTDQAAAVMLQGMTAHYLATSTYRLRSGDDCLIHAAAGGVGLLFCQIASQIGARVFGTASTDAKAELAMAAGAKAIVDYTKKDFAVEISGFTNGAGVKVVYDSVGKTTWEKSLDCLSPLGMLVLYGNSSGPVPPIDPLLLARKGSLYLTRPMLPHYVATRNDLLLRANAVLDAVASGKLKVRIEQTFPLSDAGAAHALLESRKTAGKILLKP
ncbi:MAG: quinone oxidoreductase [Gemmatimonadaceae bacterium]